ncbi:hypothetical protein C8Q72DRAFT_794043 [Fomitopsis betulina]|nr:hypothetical protein C8Q72DRAFT_794043 [Fomitopsis betulina]
MASIRLPTAAMSLPTSGRASPRCRLRSIVARIARKRTLYTSPNLKRRFVAGGDAICIVSVQQHALPSLRQVEYLRLRATFTIVCQLPSTQPRPKCPLLCVESHTFTPGRLGDDGAATHDQGTVHGDNSPVLQLDVLETVGPRVSSFAAIRSSHTIQRLFYGRRIAQAPVTQGGVRLEYRSAARGMFITFSGRSRGQSLHLSIAGVFCRWLAHGETGPAQSEKDDPD